MFLAISIAKWFVNKSIQDYPKSGEYISISKLQKLLYYSQGFFKIFEDEELFNEKIIATESGVEITEVKDYFKEFNNIINKKFDLDENFDEKVLATLNLVYDNFAQFSSFKLYQMMKNELPFLDSKNGCEIQLEKITECFKELYIIDD